MSVKTKKDQNLEEGYEYVDEGKTFRVKPLKCMNLRQKEFIRAIDSHEITFCTGPAGSGKTYLALWAALKALTKGEFKQIILAKSVTPIPGEELGYAPGPQPLTTNICTPEGFKQFGDIRVNDLVFNCNGEPTKVLKVIPKGQQPVFKITTKDGKSTEASAEHVWKIKDSNKEYLTTTKEIFDSYKEKSLFIPINKAVQYEKQDLPLDPYLVGLFLGDGCISCSHIRFASADKEIVDYVKSIVEPLGGVVNDSKYNIVHTVSFPRKNKKDARICARLNLNSGQIECLGTSTNNTLHIPGATLIKRCSKEYTIDGYKYFFTKEVSRGNNPIRAGLAELNMIGKKACDKDIPEIYLKSSIGDRLALLQGLMDTDGTVKPEGKDSIYCTTSISLANSVVELVRSLGGIAYIHSRDRIGQVSKKWNIKAAKIEYNVYISLFSKDLNPFRLERKKVRWKPKAFSLGNRIVNVEFIGYKECQCILVEDPQHLYLTDDFIVTHNTIEEKMDPFMMSFTGNIDKLVGERVRKKLMEQGKIRVLPLAYIRGINIDDSIVLLDEAQNLSASVFKTIITRIGQNSKYIITGDTEQIDLKNKKTSVLSKVIDLFKEDELIGTIKFEEEDCVRNPIIPHILEKLKILE